MKFLKSSSGEIPHSKGNRQSTKPPFLPYEIPILDDESMPFWMMSLGKYGWIKPTVPVEHPMADRHKVRPEKRPDMFDGENHEDRGHVFVYIIYKSMIYIYLEDPEAETNASDSNTRVRNFRLRSEFMTLKNEK